MVEVSHCLHAGSFPLSLIIFLFEMTCCGWQDHFGNKYQDVFVSPERCAKIVTDFKDLDRPIQFHQKEIFNPFCSHYTLTLEGKWKNFMDNLTRAEVVFALWPLLDDVNTSLEASAVIMAKLNLQYTDGNVYNTDDLDLRSKMWKSQRVSVVRECRFLSRQTLGVGQFWEPHEILFDFDSIIGESNRVHSIETLRRLLSNDSVLRNNPQEVRRILEASYALSAVELTNELIRTFFYDLSTGNDFCLSRQNANTHRSLWKPLSKPDEWKDHPDWTPEFPDVAVPRLLAKVAGKDAIPLVFDHFSKTKELARSVDIGGGFAEVIVIRYLMEKSLHLTRNQCLSALEDFLVTHRSLPDDRRSVLAHLRTTLISGRYQATENGLKSGWFGHLPFDYRILSNGDVIIGREVNERFFTVLALPGWVGTLDAETVLELPANKRLEYPNKDESVMRNYYLSAIPLNASEKPFFHQYRDKLISSFGHRLHPPTPRVGNNLFFYELELERYIKSH